MKGTSPLTMTKSDLFRRALTARTKYTIAGFLYPSFHWRTHLRTPPSNDRERMAEQHRGNRSPLQQIHRKRW